MNTLLKENIAYTLVIAAIIAGLIAASLVISNPLNTPINYSTTSTTPYSFVEENFTTIDHNVSVKTFNTYNELLSFIKSSAKKPKWIYPVIMPPDVRGAFLGVTPQPTALPEKLTIPTPTPTPMPATFTVTAATKTPFMGSTVEFSKTNVQVEGVDELDYVKTDGEFIYVARDNAVYVVKAYPPDVAEVVSKINVDGLINGIFVENKRLVVVYSKRYEPTVTIVEEPKVVMPFKITSKTYVSIFDLSEPGSPKKLVEYSAYGSLVGSRLTEKTVYIILQYPVMLKEDTIPLPVINDEVVSPTEIKYFNRDFSYMFTIILAVNVSNAEFNREVFLTGSSAKIYMSKRNLYILSIKYPDYTMVYDKVLDILLEKAPANVREAVERIKELNIDDDLKHKLIAEIASDYYNKLPSKEREEIMEEIFEETKDMLREKTVIYRFSISGLKISAEAKGEVPGRVLDQFSMDEHGDYFRVATTETIYYPYRSSETVNNVYVLNMNLEIIGKLEGLALSERIYAARFSGSMCYLVTFRRIDPLFAIDLSDPKEPKVLGYLKTPGFSEYLHPYGDHYLIGVGRDADEYGRIKGLKIALFDISDPENPKEVSHITIGNAGTWSPIFRDHKAFMINENKSYFAVPIRGSVEGIYIISINGDKLSIKGFIELKDPLRTIYIDDFIYGISLWKIKIVDDVAISEIKTLTLV